MGEPLARFRLTLTAAWRMISTSGFDCLGLTEDEVYNATYDAIVKRRIAEVAFRDGNEEEIQMATYNYTYRVGRKVSHRGITNDPARREREHQRARPGGRLTVDGRSKTRAGALRTERGQTKTRGYYA